jgi:hypothetical protein
MTQDGAMSPKAVKIPGPDHPITIAPNPKRVVVCAVADAREAPRLRTADGFHPDRVASAGERAEARAGPHSIRTELFCR